MALERNPRDLFDLQGLPSSSANLIHLNKQEIKQRQQAACWDVKKELLTKLKHKKEMYRRWKQVK